MNTKSYQPVKALLLALIALATVRLLGFLVAFGEGSLQMDFSAFYTAGEAHNAGLSPYTNHYDASPPIWDGVDEYMHSRFLYPPLAAALFGPLARIPYHEAKYLWMFISLASVAASLLVAARAAGLSWRSRPFSLCFLALVTFHPLLTLLERGQMDGLLLLLITLGGYWLALGKHPRLAGFVLTVAMLFKLHTVLILPFLLVRRKWRVLVGCAEAGLAIITLSLVLCGPAALTQYAWIEFPRIAVFGEAGTKAMHLDPATLATLRPTLALTAKGGRTYAPERFSFVQNASLARTYVGRGVQRFLSALRLPHSVTAASLLIFSFFLVSLSTAEWRARSPVPDPSQEFLYWQLVLVVVLLCAPLTWAMNTVWLVCLFPYVFNQLTTPCSRRHQLGLIALALGLLAAALPDTLTFSLMLPFHFLDPLFEYKYIAAELGAVAGLVLCLDCFKLRAVAPTGSLGLSAPRRLGSAGFGGFG